MTTDKVYTVSVAKTGRWACDCPAHRFCKAPKKPCKHILRVQGVEEFKGLTVNEPKTLKAAVFQNAFNAVVRLPGYTVVQTHREICLEED